MAGAVNIFFLGKGGVGKSTSSALQALALANAGARVLLVSLDPAHNQGDIFTRSIGSKPVSILPNLEVMEIDQERWIKRYLHRTQQQLKHTYSYLSAFNLDHHFKVLKYSPGLEEYALLLAFQHIMEKYSRYDYLLFDMPPTALALKFFNLPQLSLLWLEQLLVLRREIIRKKEMITTVKLGKKVSEHDKVLRQITTMQHEYTQLRDIFQDSTRTQVQLVINDDKLSQAESERIATGLHQISIALQRIINNKRKSQPAGIAINPLFTKTAAVEIPLAPEPLIGLDSLRRFLQADNGCVARQLCSPFSRHS